MKLYRTAIVRQTAAGLVLVAFLGGCAAAPVAQTREEIDAELQVLDTQIQQVNPEDYSESQLADL